MSTRSPDGFGPNDPAAAMKAYIRHYFADLLGQHEVLLDQPGGLDRLAELVRRGQLGPDDAA